MGIRCLDKKHVVSRWTLKTFKGQILPSLLSSGRGLNFQLAHFLWARVVAIDITLIDDDQHTGINMVKNGGWIDFTWLELAVCVSIWAWQDRYSRYFCCSFFFNMCIKELEFIYGVRSVHLSAALPDWAKKKQPNLSKNPPNLGGKQANLAALSVYTAHLLLTPFPSLSESLKSHIFASKAEIYCCVFIYFIYYSVASVYLNKMVINS